MSRIVIALGGNALGLNVIEQVRNVSKTTKTIACLIKEGHEILITHGNGPQVGLIHLAFSEGAKANDRLFEMPFPECGAMSQGYIGYHLQNALATDLGPNYPVASLITQVEVDPMDPMFGDPTKPIGSFYTEEQAKTIARDKGYVMKQDADGGYRRVIASPKPVGIVEIEAIKTLLKDHFTVISVGGGGIPVVKNNGIYTGVDAVIDKDFASSLLAREVHADILLILTAVSQVSLHYHEPNEIRIHRLSVKEAKNYINEGHFAEGSMLPKVEAAIEFVKGHPYRKAIITSLEDMMHALDGQNGTLIYEEEQK